MVDFVWTGADDNDWTNELNWDLESSYPQSGSDTATFNAGAVDCTVDAAISCGAVTTTSDYTGTITLSNKLTSTAITQGANNAFSGGELECSGAVDFDGTISGTVNLTLKGSGNIDLAPASGTLSTVTINSSGNTYTLVTTKPTIATLTITAGTLTDATNNLGITVSTITTVVGTLTLGSGTCQFGASDYETSYGLRIDGTFNGGSGAHSISSISPRGGSTTTLSSGTTTITGHTIGTYNTFVYYNSSAITYSHGNGTVVFNDAGEQDIYVYSNGSFTLFYNLQTNNASTVLAYGSGKGCSLTVANNFTITLGTFNSWDGTTSYALTVTNVTTVTGTLDCKAGTMSFGSGVTSAYVLVVTGTFTGGSATITSGGVYNNSGTFTSTSGVHTINAARTETGIGLALKGTNGDYNNGTFTFTAGTQCGLYSSESAETFGTFIINNASCNMSYNATHGFALTCTTFTITAGTFTSWDGTTSKNLTVSGLTTISGTLDVKAGTIQLGTAYTTGSYAVDIVGTFTGGSGTITTGAVRLTATGTWTATSGTHTVSNASSGGYIILFYSGGTFTCGTGTIAITQTLGDRDIWLQMDVTFNVLTFNGNQTHNLWSQGTSKTVTCATLNITLGIVNLHDSGSGQTHLTVTGATTIAGTLICDAGTCSFGSTNTTDYGLTVSDGGTFTGGSGTHTAGSLFLGAGTVTLTSGTTTIDAGKSSTDYLAFRTNGTTFSSPGTVTFTRNGDQLIQDNNNTTRTFTTVILNKASGYVQYRTNFGFSPTITTLTITSGTFNSWDGVVSHNLTVSGLTTISGTLDVKAGTMSLGSGRIGSDAVLLNDGGTFTGGTGTHTIGNLVCAGTNTLTLSTGTTSINGRSSSLYSLILSTTTFSSPGTITFNENGTQLIGDLNNTARSFTTFDVTKNAGNATVFAAGYSFDLTITGNCTVTTGTLALYETGDATAGADVTIGGDLTLVNSTSLFYISTGATKTLTVSGATTVDGTLGTASSNGEAHSFASIEISSGGTYRATDGTTTVTGDWSNSGTFTHSDGTVTFSGAGLHTLGGTNVFKTLTAASSARVESSGNITWTTLTYPSGTAFIFTTYGGVANAYHIYIGSTLNKDAITSDFSSTSNVVLFAGILEANETAAATSFWIKSGTTLDINSGITFTCCNVTPDGTFIVDGTWACGSASFEAYTLDAPNYLFIANRLDWNNILEADL